jgi:hypothetical protein
VNPLLDQYGYENQHQRTKAVKQHNDWEEAGTLIWEFSQVVFAAFHFPGAAKQTVHTDGLLPRDLIRSSMEAWSH